MGIKSFQGPLRLKSKKIHQDILVKDYMFKNVITFSKSDCIYDVMRELFEQKISGAPVVNKYGELVGIISESDLMKNIVDGQYYNLPISNTKVSKYMKKSVDYISPDRTIFEAASRFLKLRRKIFPVVKSNRIIGIISRVDIMYAALKIRSQMWNS